MNTTNAQHLPSIEEFKQQAKELKKPQNTSRIHNHIYKTQQSQTTSNTICLSQRRQIQWKGTG